MTKPLDESAVLVAEVVAAEPGAFRVLRHLVDELSAAFDQADVRAAVLLQSGHYLVWLQGSSNGLDAALAALAQRRDLMRNLEPVLRGYYPESLPERWNLVWMQRQESRAEVKRRLRTLALRREAAFPISPLLAWRIFSTGVLRSVSDAQVLQPAARVLLVSRPVEMGLQLVNHASLLFKSPVVAARVAGTSTRLTDVATAYVDRVVGGRVPVRLMAIARNGLRVGLFRLLVADFVAAVIMTEGSGQDAANLFDEVHQALTHTQAKPLIIGLSSSTEVLQTLASCCTQAGHRFLPVSAVGHFTPEAWQALSPLIEDAVSTAPASTRPLYRN